LKCKNDSLLITASGNFNSVFWTPNYNMIVASFAGVILFPTQDTIYHLTVMDARGCKGSADLRINIMPSVDVKAGNDTSFCFGGHAVFTASGNFTSYAWSNGGNFNSIDVQTTGKYSVMAMDANGCKSYDTVSLTVYHPEVHISGGTVLCRDQTLILEAGAGFASYDWQHSTTAAVYNVVDTGYYRVQVADGHQCTTADSIHIANFAEAPEHFLPSDTIVCSYLGALIQPAGEFAQYNWSTGETGKSIQVKTAGEYYLNVVNQQGCRGTDSIRIELKNCEALLVFPNAFTPNHDGLNDVFRLKYPGHAADYRLQIFNRWGQKIFETSDTSAGWDGTFNSQFQPEGTYVWILRYADNSGKKHNMQGTVVLIR
jgi:gliding motility-associated-like protein